MLSELHKFYMRNVFIYHIRMQHKKKRTERNTKRKYKAAVAKNVFILCNFPGKVLASFRFLLFYTEKRMRVYFIGV